MEKMFTDFDIFLQNKDARSLYIDYLDSFMQKDEAVLKAKKMKARKDDPVIFTTDKEEKNFLKKNRRK